MKAEGELSCRQGAPSNATILASWGDCPSAQDEGQVIPSETPGAL